MAWRVADSFSCVRFRAETCSSSFFLSPSDASSSRCCLAASACLCAVCTPHQRSQLANTKITMVVVVEEEEQVVMRERKFKFRCS